MTEIGPDLVPRYIPTTLDHDLRGIAPVRALTGLADQNHLNCSLSVHLMSDVSHELTRLRSCPKIWSLTMFTTIEEELHPGER